MKITLFALLNLVLSAACFAADYEGPFEFATGTKRAAAQVYLPKDYQSRSDWPVVLLLHGYTATGKMQDFYFGLSSKVSERGFVLVVPNGMANAEGKQYWNATDGCCDFEHTNVDDVGYLRELLQQVRSQYKLSQNKVFALGHSNGGFMAYRLACEADQMVDGIMSLAGATFKNPADCKATKPVTILQVHAIDDGTVKYEGDEVGFPRLAPYPGALATVAQWAQRDGCEGEAAAGETIDLVSMIPGADTSSLYWRNCQGGAKVGLWTIQAYKADRHHPHVPWLTPAFLRGTLDFLLPAAGGVKP